MAPSLITFLQGLFLSPLPPGGTPAAPSLPHPHCPEASQQTGLLVTKASRGSVILQVTSLSCFPHFLKPPPRQGDLELSSPVCFLEERKITISKNYLVTVSLATYSMYVICTYMYVINTYSIHLFINIHRYLVCVLHSCHPIVLSHRDEFLVFYFYYH